MTSEERLLEFTTKATAYKRLFRDVLIAFGCKSSGEVRIARTEDGLLYASKTERRGDYADETLCWPASPREAVDFIDKMEEQDDN